MSLFEYTPSPGENDSSSHAIFAEMVYIPAFTGHQMRHATHVLLIAALVDISILPGVIVLITLAGGSLAT